MNIKISADSTCDLSPELIARYDIGISPLYIVRDGESLVDGVDITPDEIYAHVEKGGSMCSTAAVSVYDYVEFFRKELESADAVVHFHISGEMSACYQNACIAATEVGNVYPVDAPQSLHRHRIAGAGGGGAGPKGRADRPGDPEADEPAA